MDLLRIKTLAGLEPQPITEAVVNQDMVAYNKLLDKVTELGYGTPEGAQGARQLGRMAFLLGLTSKDNPFYNSSDEFYRWHEAWNAAAQSEARMESVEEPKEDTEDKEDKPVKVKVPADVAKSIASRISELKAAIDEFDNKGYNDDSVKQNAIEALEQIADNLKKQDGKEKASLFVGTLMGPILDLIPPKVVKFLISK